MQWMNLAGLWAAIGLAIVLFLYLLKQRMEPVTVSSTYLWRKALAAQEASRPIQKLKRSLLFFVQMLLALLLLFALLRPMTVGGYAGEVVFVFDLSASMQAVDGQGSRMEQAVRDAQRRTAGLPDGTRVSILTADAQVRQPLTRSEDRVAAGRALSAIEAGNGGADLAGAMSLALALQKELPDLEIIVYTDQTLAQTGVTQPAIGKGVDNRSLLSLQAEDVSAVARAVNYGAAGEWTLECYADGVLCDLRTVAMAEGETVSVHFDLPQEAQTVEVRIAEPDGLAVDNVRYWVRGDARSTTIVLAGRDNIFLEKALALRGDISVLKTTLAEASAIQRGTLMVIDGPLPETLPEKGALLLIDPEKEAFGITPGAKVNTPTSLRAAQGPQAERLNEYLQVPDIQVSSYRPLSGEGTPLWLADGQPVLMLVEKDGRRVAVLGFDIHDANLPLLKEFPIWMQRLLSYLAPEPIGEGLSASCGDVLMIRPQAFAQAVTVELPSGQKETIDTAGGTLTDTRGVGIYTMRQTDDEGVETAARFALHIPAAEADVRQVAVSRDAGNLGQGALYGREWTVWLIGLLLALVLLEWWVYRRGY